MSLLLDQLHEDTNRVKQRPDVEYVEGIGRLVPILIPNPNPDPNPNPKPNLSTIPNPNPKDQMLKWPTRPGQDFCLVIIPSSRTIFTGS